jgi:hypothetical protein
MSVTLAGYNFESPGIIRPVRQEPWEVNVVRKRWFAVIGETTLVGAKTSRRLSMPVHYYGAATHVALQGAIANLQSYVEVLNGTLTVDFGGGDSSSWTNVTFTGFEITKDPFVDGSGVNGWQIEGNLNFRQIAE